VNRTFQCECCQPPRQVYSRAEGQLDRIYHEHDHTPAVESEPELEKRRRRADARTAGQQDALRLPR
jgi:hypothetical protein